MPSVVKSLHKPFFKLKNQIASSWKKKREVNITVKPLQSQLRSESTTRNKISASRTVGTWNRFLADTSRTAGSKDEKRKSHQRPTDTNDDNSSRCWAVRLETRPFGWPSEESRRNYAARRYNTIRRGVISGRRLDAPRNQLAARARDSHETRGSHVGIGFYFGNFFLFVPFFFSFSFSLHVHSESGGGTILYAPI